ncbi:MAG: ABC transporter permease [Bryobacteraceae bacterium]|nr:ABC transporter permease [Bryobacteraceae bacterium]
MKGLLTDLRFALRTIRRKPSFAAATVATLALGVAVNVLVFTVVNGVLLRPLPYDDPATLVRVFEAEAKQPDNALAVSRRTFDDWQRRITTLTGLAGYAFNSMNLSGAREPAQLRNAQVTEQFFATLRARPLMGRVFEPGDFVASGQPVVVLSHGMWQDQFGADGRIIGRVITLDGRGYTVAGIMPAGFKYPQYADFWEPLGRASSSPDVRELSVIARRVAPESQVRAELSRFVSKDAVAGFESLLDEAVGDARTTLLLFFAAVGFLFLIACANVSNLFLARATERSREIGVRLALGAGRLEVVRFLLAESLLLCVAGGVIGLLAGAWSVDALLVYLKEHLPRTEGVAVDWRVALFALGLSCAAALVFALAPALRYRRLELTSALRDGGRGQSANRRRRRLRDALVVAEVSLAAMLLFGAGLLFRSLTNLIAVEPGYDADRVLAAGVVVPFPDTAKRTAFFRQTIDEAARLPEVESVAACNFLPLWGSQFLLPVRVAAEEPRNAGVRSITPAYFRTLGIELRQGRDFEWTDAADTEKVAIVNQTLADRYFPRGGAIGRHIEVVSRKPVSYRIIGVVADVRHEGRMKPAIPELFLNYPQYAFGYMNFVARARNGKPAELANGMRKAIAAVDPARPVFAVSPLSSSLDFEERRPRLRAALLAAFSGLGLMLACFGLYSMISYLVGQRTQELGIRIALGAQAAQVFRLVLRQGAMLAAAGLFLGIAGSFAVARAARSFLFEVSPLDTLTYGTVIVILLTVALAACAVPARRAMKVDPLVALREE